MALTLTAGPHGGGGGAGRWGVLWEWDHRGTDARSAVEIVLQPGRCVVVQQRTVPASAVTGPAVADAVATQPVRETALTLPLPPSPPASDDRLHTLGWTLRGDRLCVWAVVVAGAAADDDDGGPPRRRTTLTAEATLTRDATDDGDDEASVAYWLGGRDVLLHELRLASPAPSGDAWRAVVQALDAKWSAAAV